MVVSADALRIAAQHSLTAFATLTHPNYVAGWHHRLIADALSDVAAGNCKLLAISMPPRHGKSELASVRFAPWLLTQRPRASVISATYSGDFADDLGRKARGVLELPIYGAMWPGSRLAADNRAVSRWQTVSGGSYYAVGVGGPLTGRGADILLIDDPHKNREEAESQTMRERVWDWFRSTAYTRLEKNGAVVIIMTRWHEDDLVGRCLATGEPWRVLSLPAIAEEDEVQRKRGEALWPQKYDVEVLEQIRRTVGEREWSALYQQRPAPLEGGLFKPDKIQIIDALPAGATLVRAWDLGATANGGDPTAGGLLGQLSDGRFVIGDMVRLQASAEDVVAIVKATASRDGHHAEIHLPQDPGQAGKAQVQYLTRELVGYIVKSSPETGSKVLRAEPLAAQVNVGNVLMVRGPWNQSLLDEMRVFPNGAHDDQVDCLSRGFGAFYAPNSTGILDFYRNQATKAKANGT